MTVSDYGRYGTPGHSRGDNGGSNPARGVLLEASDRKRSPRVDLAIREEDVGWIHEPSTVSFEEGANVGFRGDRSLWESAQAVLLDGCLAQELRLDALVVVRISTLEETYIHVWDQIGVTNRCSEGTYRIQYNTGNATQFHRPPQCREV